jgi:hypothetical protein
LADVIAERFAGEGASAGPVIDRSGGPGGRKRLPIAK